MGRALHGTGQFSDNGGMADPDTKKPDLDALARARAAGLDKAVERFPDCVKDAARAAAADLADMPAIDGTTEPWPPMQIRSTR